MVNVATERRSCIRMSAAYPVNVMDLRGRLLGRGRTANISESGVYILLCPRSPMPENGQINLELTVPGLTDRPNGRPSTRKVLYASKVVRTVRVGNMLAIGVQFLKKLA